MDERWFKLALKKAGKSAGDVADRMGRARSNISNIFAGRQRMSLDWAQAFADTIGCDVATVLEKAGEAPAAIASLRPGFAESDVAAWTPAPADEEAEGLIARALGRVRNGIDVWRVKSRALELAGYLPGDFLLVDSHAADRARAGDVVIAQVYARDRPAASTVLRRLEPPVLVSATTDPEDQRVHVVDNVNVLVRGKVIASWRSWATSA